MAKEDNLMPIQEVNSRRTREQHSEDSRRAGKASGEARRKKKLMKEQAELLLSLPLIDKDATKQMQKLGIDTDNIDNQMALLVSMLRKGIKTGDKSIAEFFRDTTDGKPKETIEVTKPIDETTKEVDAYLCNKKKN